MSTPGAGWWLAKVTIDGREYRWSVARVEVDGEDPYETGLGDLEVAAGAESIDLTITDPSVDWPALALAVDGGDASLSRLGPNDAAPVAFVVGEARLLEFGARYDPVRIRVERRAGATSLGKQVPDVFAKVDATTWPDGTADVVLGDDGATYPVVLGYPGYLGTGDDTYPVMPAPLAQYLSTGGAGDDGTSSLLVIAEDGERPITAVLVRDGLLGPVELTRAAYLTTDLRGKRVRVADFALVSGDLNTRPDARGHDYMVGFYPSGGGGPRNAYDVVAYFLRRWEGSVDWSRLPEVRDALARYLVDSWLDSTVSDPWAWVEGTLLAALPFEVRSGARGLYLVERRYVSDPDRNVGTLDIDNGDAAIASSVGISDGGPFSEFTAHYRRGRDGDWLATAILTGQDGAQSARRTAGGSLETTARSGRCTRSAARYGDRQADPIDLGWCWDEGTAIHVLEDTAAREALPARMISYRVPDGDQLTEGDEVTLYDEDRGFDGVAAIVDGPPVVGSAAVTVPFRIPQ